MKLSRTAVGLAVKAARIAAGLSAADLAKGAGLSASAISRTEAGIRALEFVEALSIASAVGVDVETLRTLAENFEREGLSKRVSALSEIESDLLELQRLAVESAIHAVRATAKAGN